MTDKKIWVSRPGNERTEFALLSGAAERDQLVPFGWAEPSAEPGPDAWVWMRYEGIDGAQVFPIESVPHWTAKGWFPAAPPEHVDPTKEPKSGPMSLAALSSAAEPVKPAAVGKSSKE